MNQPDYWRMDQRLDLARQSTFIRDIGVIRGSNKKLTTDYTDITDGIPGQTRRQRQGIFTPNHAHALRAWAWHPIAYPLT